MGECDVELWSISAAERHRRAFDLVELDPSDVSKDQADHPILAVRSEYLLSPDLVAALKRRTNVVLTTTTGDVAVAVHASADNAASALAVAAAPSLDTIAEHLEFFDVLNPDELGSNYDNALRKRAKPYAVAYADTSTSELEERTFGAAYKGATDFVTKWLWPRPARSVTRWCAKHGITPNTVTSASLVLVLLAMWLFWQGYFLVALPLAWAMTFLDTVDGKLARVTVTSSPWGNIYDHGIDLVHPPFWWWAWYVGVLPTANPTLLPSLLPALWVIIVGYVIGRLLEGLFVLAFKIETHIWRPVDYFFRTITARRNPNLAILTLFTLAGRPDFGFVCVAIWTILSLLFHTVRLVQAAVQSAQGRRIVSWLNPGA